MKNSFKIALYVVLTPIGLVLALVLLLAVYIFARSGDIAPIDDSDLRVEEQVVADEDNMLVALLSVTNRLTVSMEDGLLCTTYRTYRWNGLGLPSKKYPDLQEVQSTVDRVLSDNVAYFEGLHVAASRPSYKVTERDVLIVPPILALMTATKMLKTKALRETERKEYDAALQTLRDLSAFGRRELDNPCGMLDLLIGLGVEGLALKSVRDLACAEAVPDEILRSLSDSLKEDLNPNALFELALLREYNNNIVPTINYLSDSANLRTLEGFIYNEELENGTSVLSRLSRAKILWAYLYKPETTRRDCAEWVRRLREGSSLKPIELKRNIFKPNVLGLVLQDVILPEGEAVSRTLKEGRVGLSLTRLTIAAQRYRRAHDGAYPPDLEALVPEFLPSVPEDPLAPGRPLNYDAKTLYVWSVGREGTFSPNPEQKIHNLSKHRVDLLDWSVRLDGKIPGEEFRKKEPIKRKARQD